MRRVEELEVSYLGSEGNRVESLHTEFSIIRDLFDFYTEGELLFEGDSLLLLRQFHT